LEGYSVTSLSRRGLPPDQSPSASSTGNIEYRKGDARDKESITNILKEGGYCGMFIRTFCRTPSVKMVELLTCWMLLEISFDILVVFVCSCRCYSLYRLTF
jgi:hypothetical protein